MFYSDNISTACPEVIEAVLAANRGDAPGYGADPWSARLGPAFSEAFETEVAVHPVATGIAANSLALAAAMPAPGAALCHVGAHVTAKEAGAPEFFSGGGKLIGLPGAHGLIDPDTLAHALERHDYAKQNLAPPTALSLTQATDEGTVYALDHLAALTAVARRFGLVVHMDGARFENARAALGVSAAETSWRVGVDILAWGATKNGGMTGDALLIFQRSTHAAQLGRFMAQRRGRAGQVFSKMRFVSAQLLGLIEGGVAARNAAAANRAAGLLAAGLAAIPGVGFAHPVEVNEVFAVLPAPVLERLARAGLAPGPVGSVAETRRFVTSWNTEDEAVVRFLAAAREDVAAAA